MYEKSKPKETIVNIEIGNADIYVRKTGVGEPLLLIHGVPDSADMWDEVVADLSERYTCYAIDLPGFHRSGMPDDFQFDLESYGKFINQVVCKLNIVEPLTLMLHDWGGIFGMSFACQYPEKIKHIAGASFIFSHLYRWHAWARIWQTPILGELAMLTTTKAVFVWEVKRGSPRISQQHLDQTFDRYNRWSTKIIVLKLYRSAKPSKLIPFQKKLEALVNRVHIDLVWGENDPYVDSKYAKLISPRTIKLLENCGHWTPVEAPQEMVGLLDPS